MAPKGWETFGRFSPNVLRGRRVAPERVEEVAKHYEHFGGVSPLAAITRGQVEGLKSHLAARGLKVPVYLGMRNWHPLLPDTLREMAKDGVQRALDSCARPTGPTRVVRSIERTSSRRGRRSSKPA